MRAMVLKGIASFAENPAPLVLAEMPEPAPLLCAGAIGYRSLRLANLRDGQNLGLTGFGASAHLVLKMVRHQFPRVKTHVFARSERERLFARRDILEFLALAETTPIRPDVEEVPLAEANRALAELKAGKIRGAKVLQMGCSR